MEDRAKRNTQAEQLHEKGLKKYEDSLRQLQDNTKCNNIQIIGMPEGEEREQGIENLFEKIMTENIPNPGRGKAMQVQGALGVKIRMNPKRPTLRHITIKIPSFKDRETLKGSKGGPGSNIQEISHKASS